jgi:hypothetical protein
VCAFLAQRITAPLISRAYIAAIIAVGTGLLGSVRMGELRDPALAAGLLAATILLSMAKLRLPLGKGASTLSLAYTVDLVAIIMDADGLAVVLGAIGALIQCTVGVRRKQAHHRAAFSAATVIISVQLAAWAWRALGGNLTAVSLGTTVLPLMVCAITYYIVNTSLVVGAIALASPVSPMRAWDREFLITAPAYLVSAVVAALVALTILDGNVILLPVVASPLYVCYCRYQQRWNETGEPHRTRVAAQEAAA